MLIIQGKNIAKSQFSSPNYPLMQEFHHNTLKGMLWINNWTWFQWLQDVIQTKKDPTNPHYDAVLFGICILREFNISFMYNSTSICIQMYWWQKYEWFASCSDSYMVLRRQGELQILSIHSADLNLQASTKNTTNKLLYHSNNKCCYVYGSWGYTLQTPEYI